MCRVGAAVAGARRQKDIIKLLCNDDKLAQMRALVAVRAAAEARPAEAPDSERRHHAAVAALAVERIVALDREAAACVGEDLAYLPDSSATFDAACLAARAPAYADELARESAEPERWPY